MPFPLVITNNSPSCSLLVSHAGTWHEVTGDVTRLSTSKSLSDPTGMWSAGLSGARKDGALWSQLLGPNDYVEIRFGQKQHRSDMPLVMRGFTDIVTASATDSQMACMVSGRNFGKVLINAQVYYLSELDPGNAYQHYLTQDLGLSEAFNPIGDLIDKALNAFVLPRNIKPLQANDPHVPALGGGSQAPANLGFMGMNIDQYEGSIINLLQSYAGTPWCELYIVENSRQSALVHRWSHLKNKSGTIPAPFGYVNTTDPHILSLQNVYPPISLSRSDNELYNYFYVTPANYPLIKAAPPGLASPGANPILNTASIGQHGFSPMRLTTNIVPVQVGLPSNQIASSLTAQADLCAALCGWLNDVYSFAETLYATTLTIVGDPSYEVGEYVRIPEWELEFYIEGVTHTWTADNNGTYTTQLTLTRGQSFAKASPARGN